MKRLFFDPLYHLKGTAQGMLLASVLLCTILMLYWVEGYLPYGFDFADESLHIVSMADPFEYDFALTLFGFVLHPLYLFLDGSISALRFLNLATLFVLAAILCYTYFQTVLPDMSWSRLQFAILSAGAATIILVYYDSWQPTPSYNSLALQGVLLANIGLLMATTLSKRASKSAYLNISHVILGVGGWLTFMAKPTSAIGLAVVTVIFLIATQNLRIKSIAIAASTALILLMLSALLIDGSLIRFVQRMYAGFELLHYLQTDHSLLNSFKIDTPKLSRTLLMNIGALSFFCIFAAYCMTSTRKIIFAAGLALSAAFFGAAILIIVWHQDIVLKIGAMQGLLIFAAVLPAILLPLLIKGIPYFTHIPRNVWAISALLAVSPHIYAFGSGNNLWLQGSSGALFWFLSGITILTPLISSLRSVGILIPLISVAQLSTAALVQTGMQDPTRQPFPIWTFTAPVTFGHSDAPIILDRGFADYISDARTTAQAVGFVPGTSLIDLSGVSPGILHALQAKSIGLPWMIGRLLGSQNYAQAALERVNCEKFAQAWVLLEPNGPRSISSDLMINLGADFPNSYKLMGQWQTAFGRANHKEIATQMLYRPIDSDLIARECAAKRGINAP